RRPLRPIPWLGARGRCPARSAGVAAAGGRALPVEARAARAVVPAAVIRPGSAVAGAVGRRPCQEADVLQRARLAAVARALGMMPLALRSVPVAVSVCACTVVRVTCALACPMGAMLAPGIALAAAAVGLAMRAMRPVGALAVLAARRRA